MTWLRSDSIAGVSDEILAAMNACNEGLALPYGDDPLSRQLDARFSTLFERPVKVVPVTSGTAANALALASIAGPFDLIACHDDAHAFASETGATEFLSGGARFLRLPGRHGRVDLASARATIGTMSPASDKSYRLAAMTLTQLTEAGTAYPAADLKALGALAREHGLRVHIDGARFANAVAALDVHPAELSWGAGAELMSFGATKNGAMYADAVICFGAERPADLPRRRKRAGHDVSKARFVAAQLLAYLDDDLWLRNARHANAMAARLAECIGAATDIALVHPVDGNVLFIAMDDPRAAAFAAADMPLRAREQWPDGRRVYRIVTSFRTDLEEVRRFARVAGVRPPRG